MDILISPEKKTVGMINILIKEVALWQKLEGHNGGSVLDKVGWDSFLINHQIQN